ncbi:MAG TPA: AAA family ATPase [Terriglobales bacterium]|nr:AAA family ATPase [Terriglobales bacterium]
MRCRFDSFELDLFRRELRGAASPLSIQPKDLDLLAYLIRCRDRFATKDELLDQFWPEPEAFEGLLTSAVSRLRRIIGADAIVRMRPCSYRFTRTIREVEAPQPAPSDSELRPPVSADFVGRVGSLVRLCEAIDAARQGSGGVFLIAGEAGIGKSRLMEEAVRYARAGGTEALIARAGEEHSQIPYWLWRHALADYTAGRPASGRTADQPDGIELDWPTLEHVPPIGASRDPRLAFFDAVSGVFLRAAAAAPLLIAFDDLHAADVASLQLLCFVARRCSRARILVIGTLRDAEPTTSQLAAAALATLRRDPRCSFLSLHPLSEQESIAFLNHLGGTLPASVRAAILTSADGNPFLLRECLHRAVERHGDDSQAALSPNTEVVADLFAPRLNRLSPTCFDVLGVAATCGRELDAALALRISGYSSSEFADAIDEARAARLIVAVRGRSTQLRFAHQLVRDFVYQRCSPERRRQYHRRAAEILEAEYGEDPGERLAELAHHWDGAAHDDCAEQAIERLHELSDWMWNRLGFEDAIPQLERCLALVDRYRPSWKNRRWQICMSLAWTHQRLGDQVAANAAFDRVRQILGVEPPLAGDRSCSALRLLATAELAAERPHDVGEAGERPLLPPPCQRGTIVALRMATEGLERARQYGDPAILASALMQLCWRIPDVYSDERLAHSVELMRLARAGSDRDLEQEARFLHLHYRLVGGDIRAVDHEIAAFATTLDQTPDPLFAWLHQCLLAMRTHLEGRFAESEAHVLRANEVGAELPPAATQTVVAGQLFAIRTSKGRTAEALPLLEMVLAASPRQTGARAVVASALCELGRFDEARANMELLSANRFRAVFDSPVDWFPTSVGLARTCERLGLRREAAVLYDAILPYANTCVVGAVALNCYGATEGYLAMLAAAMGRRGQAARHFDAALVTNARLGAWPALAHAQYEYARFLLRGRRTDRAHAPELLRRARATAVDMEMSGLVEWIDALR